MDDDSCKICQRTGLSLFEARHKELGFCWICQECWVRAELNNELVGGSGTSGPSCTCR